MPIYEYRCGNCQRRVSILVQGFKSPPSPECPRCGDKGLTRLFSSFSIGKSESYMRDGLYEDILSDSKLVHGLESNDPRALAEWTRRMSQATGEEMEPEHEDIMGKLEAGEPVDQVMAEAQSMMADTGGEED
ncbi:MAG TPA: hypothetical protein DCY61_02390 [Dehalococcoidia bacterium]|nr:hypothetical protein [Dehalococcoidia bacterium]